MIQLLQKLSREIEKRMMYVKKTAVTVLAITALGFALGRMAVRVPLNLLLGGTTFGGTVL